MCGGVHYGEVEGLASVERWSCSRGASCVVVYTVGRLRDWPYFLHIRWNAVFLEVRYHTM